MRRWKEASDAFLVAALFVAVVSVGLSVLTLALEAGRVAPVVAQDDPPPPPGGDGGGGGDSGGEGGAPPAPPPDPPPPPPPPPPGGDGGGGGAPPPPGGGGGGGGAPPPAPPGGAGDGGTTAPPPPGAGGTGGGTVPPGPGSGSTGFPQAGDGGGGGTGSATNLREAYDQYCQTFGGAAAQDQCRREADLIIAAGEAYEKCQVGGDLDQECARAILEGRFGAGVGEGDEAARRRAREDALATQRSPGFLASGGPLRALAPGILPVRDEVAVAVEAVGTPVSATASTLAIASALATIAAILSSVPGGLIGVAQSFMPFLAARRRQAPWGRVIEAGTNLPIAGAVITILDAAGKPRHTVQSRGDGTFGVLLPKGTYSFDVRKAEYALVTERATVPLFEGEEQYHGPFAVTSEEKVIPLVVVLRPLTARARRTTFRQDMGRWWERFRVLQSRLAIPILLIGAAINTVVLLQAVTPLLVAFEILYAVLFLLEILLSRAFRRALGRARDALKRAPVALAIVRLVDASTKRLVTTRVTTPQGQFLLMPPPGRYVLQVIHTAYVPYVKEDFAVGRGIGGTVRVQVDLQPRRT